MTTFDYPLILKQVLASGVSWAPDQEIIYRDQLRYTYRDMYGRVLRLAGALQAAGVRPGTPVGVIEWDSHRYLEMYFGIPGVGAVLHTINPRLAPMDVGYIIQHAADEVLIFHEDFLPLVEALRPQLLQVRKFIIISETPERKFSETAGSEEVYQAYEDFLRSAEPLAELPDLDENLQATLSYTTGTTGRPKGVYFTHRQLVLHTLTVGLTFGGLADFGGLTKRDVYMPLTPLFHVHGWGIPFVATLLGVKQVYPGRYEPAMLLKLITGERVTFSHCVPTILQMIVGAPQVKALDLSRWKVVIGGARLPKGLAQQAWDLGIQVYAGYGMSESAPVLTVAYMQPGMEELDFDHRLDVLVKAGRPIPMVQLKVVNESGEEAAHDGAELGEILVRTPWLTPGYYKDPEQSEALWEGGWLHTGDVAHMDPDGYVVIVDRLKDMIKSGGEWISSLELENLLSLHPGVQEAAVIGVPDPTWGERPLAIVVPRMEHKDTLLPADLQAHLDQFVERGVITSWAVPEQYSFVEELPKTSVGKMDKRALRVKTAAQHV